MVYQSYHSDLKIAANLGVLAPEFATVIPASTLHRFRTADYSQLVGLQVDLAESMQLVRQFARDQNAQAVFRAALRVKHLLVRVVGAGRSVVNALARHKARVVKLVDAVRPVLGEHRMLTWLGITKTRFTRWRNQISLQCPVSLRSLCLRTHPQQLSVREVRTIGRVMREPRFAGWPVASVYWRTVRDGQVACALSTFGKYVRRLGLSPNRPTSRRRDHATGIRASRPNQLWHADITVFRTADHLKAYIYLVIDNFSRKILAWRVAPVVSAKLHREVVLEAHLTFMETASDASDYSDITIMTDGGPENLGDYGVPLRHIIAGQDVPFSNSMIESVNKVLKYQWLYRHDISHIVALRNHLDRYVPIYNDVRPHYVHRGLTPTEVHNGEVVCPGLFTGHFAEARARRIAENRIESCPICPPRPVKR